MISLFAIIAITTVIGTNNGKAKTKYVKSICEAPSSYVTKVAWFGVRSTNIHQ
jgi:hypothetical protein